jgi:integrase/recombinase XerD
VDSPTFKKALDAFFKGEAKYLADTTVKRYYAAAPALLKAFGHKKFNHIKPIDIENFIKKRSGEFACRPGRTLRNGTVIKPSPTSKKISAASVNKELTLLKKIIGNLFDTEIIFKNPARLIKKVKEDNEAGRVLNRAEEKLYLAKCNPTYRDYAIILLETGMRPNELCEMKISNVNLASKTVFVEKGKTKAARRFIPLTARAFDIVCRRVEVTQSIYLFPGGRHRKSADTHVVKFNNAHYLALSKSKIDGENRSGTDKTTTIYSFRHTFATRFVESGGNLIALGALLGHANLKLLMRYSHPSDVHKTEAINLMSELNELMREKGEKDEKEELKTAENLEMAA